ncbi:MAG: hypothetical protein SLAVMIC_00842 [uncultured marine phage]|uniref:Uncharacterized protein n=1 Tax=uncultured marine phage TaxID=707152 RepID=A0A8D9CCV6_9VIRU|nr:MAG: hypothetical protein SLAVMIC_00842 [uncultured marine phage]
MNLKEKYEQLYGEDLNWENFEMFVEKMVRDQQTNIADEYVRRTTLMASGKFMGDPRVAEMIATEPFRLK